MFSLSRLASQRRNIVCVGVDFVIFKFFCVCGGTTVDAIAGIDNNVVAASAVAKMLANIELE